MVKKIPLFLCLCLSLTFLKIQAQKVSVERYEGSAVKENAYILDAGKNLFLIDALRSSQDSKGLAKKISEYQKPLKMIFITHGHPDHFQGLDLLHKSFPATPIYVADESIKQDIINFAVYATSQGWMDQEPSMKPLNKENTEGFDYENLIKVYSDNNIRLNNKHSLTIDILPEPTEASHSTVLTSTSLNAFFPADLISNDVFLWLGPGVNEEAVDNWLQLLKTYKERLPEGTTIYPGHGKSAGVELFEENINYLKTLPKIVKAAKSKEDAIALTEQLYPDYDGKFLLQRSVDNWYKTPKTSSNIISIEHIVDLTHTLSEDFPYIPVPGITFPFKSEPIATLDQQGVAANKWQIHEHLGTQIDAPNHFAPGGMGLDELDPTTFIVPLVVIDISAKSSEDPNAELTVEDIKKWEKDNGNIPDNACVMMYSGWDEKIGSDEFLGLDENHVKHFPGISLDAANFLLKERKISGVGVDVISFDPGYDNEYKTHKAVLGDGKWALEAVANLNKIPKKGAYLFVGSPKVKGATGGPVRLLAVW